MKVGIRASVFNAVLREERSRLGMTQFQFADFCGLGINDLLAIEGLRAIPGKTILQVREKLQRVADALDKPFDEVFPPDYLQMLADEKLPRRRKPFLWVREISLDALPPSASLLQLPDPSEMIIDEVTSEQHQAALREFINELSERERKVLTMRFGLEDGIEHTLQEIADEFGFSNAYIAQIEAKAFRKLRHPIRSRKLK